MAKAFFSLCALLLAAAVSIYLLPPWWGEWEYMAHAYTSIPYVSGWPPPHFTGVWTDYLTIGSQQTTYVNGEMHGTRRMLDLSGHLIYAGEYRLDQPWSGTCNYWSDDHPWALAEYRGGEIWTGPKGKDDWRFEGNRVTREDYKRLMHERPR